MISRLKFFTSFHVLCGPHLLCQIATARSQSIQQLIDRDHRQHNQHRNDYHHVTDQAKYDHMNGNVVDNHRIEQQLPKRAIEIFCNSQLSDKTDYHLTPHEMRLLKLVVEGHNYKTAAAELSVTVNTISFHTRRIYEKLHVHSKSEAIAKALRARLIK